MCVSEAPKEGGLRLCPEAMLSEGGDVGSGVGVRELCCVSARRGGRSQPRMKKETCRDREAVTPCQCLQSWTWASLVGGEGLTGSCVAGGEGLVAFPSSR